MSVLAAGLLAAKDQPATAGPIGLFVLLGLLACSYFLYRSMNKHLRRVPPSFGDAERPDQPGRDAP